MPTIKERKINTQTIAAKCLGNLNFVFKKVKMGSSKTANKKANKTGVNMSLAMQNIYANEIKLTNMQASFA
ncbi:hypothetical protein L1276_000239 [Flavobacterium sp. HSC-32F16]|nr:hypothetical protein [Flavobacterium sp. HSC-32F16]